jgi:hypothetical protein
MADGAVCCELLSAYKFPDKQEQYREFRQFGAVLPSLATEKGKSFLAF